jgi:hypothetical protein
MHPRTAATLDELEQAEWFSRVGVNDADSAIVVSSWVDAVRFCTSHETQSLWIEAANQYHMRILERSKERCRQWNDIANELRPVVNEFVSRKIAVVVEQHSLPKGFGDHIRWDMIYVMIEAEFADVYPPGFFAANAYWYVHGHFPCGWHGNFPHEGKRIIY